MRLLVNIIFLISSNIAFGQIKSNGLNLIGKYTTQNISHNNKQHYEEITLNSDSTFKYNSRIGGFIKQEIEGMWTFHENYLILNERDFKRKKIVVNEYYDSTIPKGKIKFTVQYFNGSSFNYKLTGVNGDTIITLKNQFDSSVLTLSSIDELYIESSLFRYPTYQVQDSSKNHFIVKLSSKRLFVDERWLIEGTELLRPMGLDNNYAGYILKKEIN